MVRTQAHNWSKTSESAKTSEYTQENSDGLGWFDFKMKILAILLAFNVKQEMDHLPYDPYFRKGRSPLSCHLCLCISVRRLVSGIFIERKHGRKYKT